MFADGLLQQGRNVCRVLPLLQHRMEGSTTLQLMLCYAAGALQQHKHVVRLCAPFDSWRQHLSGCQQGCCRTLSRAKLNGGGCRSKTTFDA